MTSRNLSRIERLEAVSDRESGRVRFLWKDLLNPDVSEATEAEAAKLGAQGYTVMIASWTQLEQRQPE
jgi:hypothetical protein